MCKKLCLVTSIILVLGTFGYAEDIQWTGAGRNTFWSTGANWDLGRVPTLDDEVRIDVPAAAAPKGPIIQDGIDAQAKGIFTEAAGESTLTMTGGTLNVAEWIWWGDGQDSFPIWTMSGGTVTVANEFELGWGGGGGTLTMTGGTVNAGEAVIPTGSGAFGHLFLYGGTYNVTKPGGLEVNATGQIDITEGTLVLEGDEATKVNDLIASGLVVSYGGTGVFKIDYDATNPGKTTVIALAEPEPEPVLGPKIAWVSYHPADDEPNPDAAAVGFTQAPDIGYTNLLKANGYDVTRVVTSQDPNVEYLNTFDLVIISRTASSGHYSGSGATLWNSITAPMMNLNGYTLRSSRLGFTDGTTMVDTTGDVKLTVTDPNHPIFKGIALTDGTMDNPYAQGAVPLPPDPSILSRGISINNNNLDEEGTVLATIAEASADTGPVGGMVIAELPAGATLENSSGSPTDVLGGPRLVFLTGSREPSGVTGGQAAALFDLYPDGERMFLNAVHYMIPIVPTDPGSDDLVAHYALDGNADDSSGNGLNGTILGDPNFVAGPMGMALDCDGVDDYVDCGSSPLFDITGDITLAIWVNTQDMGTGENNPWLGKGDTSYMIKGFRTGNQIEFFIYDGGWNSSYADVGDSFNGEWHHTAGTFNGSQFKIYVDGGLVTTLDYEGPGIVPNTYNVAIGTNTQAGGRFSQSIFDDARIYDRALSEGEIQYLAGFREPYTYDGDAAVAGAADDHDSLDGSWDHDNGSDAWDGSGIGEGNPGGASALVEDDVAFLRIQDIGDPRSLGISDPSNRKVYFTRRTGIGLDGVRLEVRMRVATSAPLDDMVDGTPWPAGGIGYHIRDNGKGMIGISDGSGIISFSLAKAGEADFEDVATDVLVMNSLVGTEASGDVDTGDAATAVNMLAIEDATQWNTFVIDIAAGGAGTHVVSISANGGPAETFEVTEGTGTEDDVPYITIGSSGTGGITAFDVDYISVSK